MRLFHLAVFIGSSAVTTAVAESSSMDGSWDTLFSIFYTYAAFIGLLGIYIINKWNIKSLPSRYDLTLGVLFRWAVVLARLAAFSHFAFVFAFSFYWFVAARWNYTPPWDEYSFSLIRTSIIVIFICSAVSSLFAFLRQCMVDLFFIDWEKPHGRLQNPNDSDGSSRNAPISVWRSLFIAHEWTKLQVSG
jgi:meckelin